LGTIQRWIHHPPAGTVQGVVLTATECAARGGVAPGDVAGLRASGSSPTRAGRVADSAVMGGKRSGHVPRAPAGPGCPHGPGPMTARTQATHTRWQQGLSRLRAYAQAHGGANPPTTAVVEGVSASGGGLRCNGNGTGPTGCPPTTSPPCRACPGWGWGRTNADRWTEGLTHLRSYLDEHGSTAVDTRTAHEGFELGAWVARRRANYHQGTLSPTRITVLEALAGWVWTRTDDQWPPGLNALRSYTTTHGTAAVPADTLHRRYHLGRWVTARRAQYQRGTLPPEQITTLQALPGWVWDVKTSRWDQGLRLLTAYAHRTGAPNPDSFYIETTEDTEDTFTLGAWAMSRRKEYRRGVLSPTRIAALEAVIDRLAVDLRAAFPEMRGPSTEQPEVHAPDGVVLATHGNWPTSCWPNCPGAISQSCSTGSPPHNPNVTGVPPLPPSTAGPATCCSTRASCTVGWLSPRTWCTTRPRW